MTDTSHDARETFAVVRIFYLSLGKKFWRADSKKIARETFAVVRKKNLSLGFQKNPSGKQKSGSENGRNVRENNLARGFKKNRSENFCSLREINLARLCIQTERQAAKVAGAQFAAPGRRPGTYGR